MVRRTESNFMKPPKLPVSVSRNVRFRDLMLKETGDKVVDGQETNDPSASVCELLTHFWPQGGCLLRPCRRVELLLSVLLLCTAQRACGVRSGVRFGSHRNVWGMETIFFSEAGCPEIVCSRGYNIAFQLNCICRVPSLTRLLSCL